MSKKNLTTEEQLLKLKKQGRLLIVFGVIVNLMVLAMAIASWILVDWPFAICFTAIAPITVFQYFLMYSTNKIAVSNLKNQLETTNDHAGDE